MSSYKIELPEVFVQRLVQLPENGMGYQRVRIVLKNGNVLYNHLVFNCSLLQLHEGEVIKPEEIASIELENSKAA